MKKKPTDVSLRSINRDLAIVRKSGREIVKKMKLKPEDVAKIVREGRN